jgi:hypothetical protein
MIACAAVAFGCGGKVVFVEDDGEPQGGSPGSSQGAAPSNGGAPTQSVGGAASGGSTVVGTPASPCEIACNTLFQCGLQSDSNGLVLCPGFGPGDQQAFLAGCNSTCEQSMALVELVDPNDCEGTVNTIQAVSPDFDNTCKFGF